MTMNAIESNPDVMNKLLAAIGVPDTFKIHDVLGTDEQEVANLPGNLKALLLVLPKDNFYKEALAEKVSNSELFQAPDVFFIQQTKDNMCGTIALIHAVVNGIESLQLDNCPLKSFIDEVKDLKPEERGNKLVENESIMAAHNEAAAEGQSNQLPGEAGHHMVCFVQV
eukprot:GFUD01112578.1.p1 GENE.GFUD01112578.1~~GFUD01112578.1.p1  ORF type:complete len:168 (+),score=48.98 GFUD01112578.1:121-624(+)